MELHTKRGKIELDHFSIYFSMRIRQATTAYANSSDDERFAVYAQAINESYETVKRCATIRGTEPTQNILNKLNLKLGKPHYVRRDYEE
jgi:hypothetical protein